MPNPPKRIQRKRTAGSKTPPNTVYCGRPGKWGNGCGPLEIYERYLQLRYDFFPDEFDEIRGKNLSCWCKLCDRHKDGKPLDEECADCTPCHVDAIGEFLYQRKER